MTKTALITGITGQDGAYLAKLLVEKGYKVFGAKRRNASTVVSRLQELEVQDQVTEIDLDLLEFSNIYRALEKTQPDEVYNLAAQSFVGVSFDQPIYTTEVDAVGPIRLLEAIRTINPKTRFYQASTSEMFGKVQEVPQRETTPFYPRSPYGAAKVYGHWITVNYRESYDMFACSGILFNHESPLRGLEFVTRKITTQLAQIKLGKREVLQLGNMSAGRDWGFAGDYVRAMWMMLQQEQADDFVVASGEIHTVREFVSYAAAVIGLTLNWEGTGEDERAVDENGRTIVEVNPQFYRPAEVENLLGDPSKARDILGWQPDADFKALVEMMAESDLRKVADGFIR